MDDERILEWLYSDLDELIDFDYKTDEKTD